MGSAVPDRPSTMLHRCASRLTHHPPSALYAGDAPRRRRLARPAAGPAARPRAAALLGAPVAQRCDGDIAAAATGRCRGGRASAAAPERRHHARCCGCHGAGVGVVAGARAADGGADAPDAHACRLLPILHAPPGGGHRREPGRLADADGVDGAQLHTLKKPIAGGRVNDASSASPAASG